MDGLQAGFALRMSVQVDVFFSGAAKSSGGDGLALGVLGSASVDAGILGVDVADVQGDVEFKVGRLAFPALRLVVRVLVQHVTHLLLFQSGDLG